jgi:hypothetical protein
MPTDASYMLTRARFLLHLQVRMSRPAQPAATAAARPLHLRRDSTRCSWHAQPRHAPGTPAACLAPQWAAAGQMRWQLPRPPRCAGAPARRGTAAVPCAHTPTARLPATRKARRQRQRGRPRRRRQAAPAPPPPPRPPRRRRGPCLRAGRQSSSGSLPHPQAVFLRQSSSGSLPQAVFLRQSSSSSGSLPEPTHAVPHVALVSPHALPSSVSGLWVTCLAACSSCANTAPLGCVSCSGLFLALTALFPSSAPGPCGVRSAEWHAHLDHRP